MLAQRERARDAGRSMLIIAALFIRDANDLYWLRSS